MKYTKDNIQGLLCTYKYNNIEYIVDNYNNYRQSDIYNRITWSIEQIIDGFNSGLFIEIGNLNNTNFEIY